MEEGHFLDHGYRNSMKGGMMYVCVHVRVYVCLIYVCIICLCVCMTGYVYVLWNCVVEQEILRWKAEAVPVRCHPAQKFGCSHGVFAFWLLWELNSSLWILKIHCAWFGFLTVWSIRNLVRVTEPKEWFGMNKFKWVFFFFRNNGFYSLEISYIYHVLLPSPTPASNTPPTSLLSFLFYGH